MRILITGGAGFIGTRLAKALSAEHDAVPSESDIRDKDLDLSGFDAIFHLAAISSPKAAEADRDLAWDVNVRGTLNICSRLRDSQKLIFLSSAHVYDKASSRAHTEEESPRPMNFYGLTKLLGEDIVRFHSSERGFSHLIFRLFNVYSPDQKPGLLVGDALQKLRAGGEAEIRNPDAVLDMVHIDDALNVFSSYGRIPDGTYNLCSGHPVSVREVYEKISEHLGREMPALKKISDGRGKMLGDNSKLRSLGFSFRRFSLG